MALIANKYWMPTHLSSWAPRAKIFPSEERWAEKGGWDHLVGSAGTESRWELKRTEGSPGLEPSQVSRSKGLFGGEVKYKSFDRMPGMEFAKSVRKLTAEA